MAKELDIFTHKDGAVYNNYEIDLIIYNDNITELDNMELDVFLFGSLILVHNNGNLDHKVCTLATRVVIPIYSEEQVVKDDQHTVIKFQPGDKVMISDTVPARLSNVQEIFNNLLTGHLSPTIHYMKYYEIILNCLKFNHELAFPRVLLEILISELFLDNTGNKPVRLSSNPYEKGVPSSITDLAQSKNTFNSMTFEDPSKAILINKGKTREQQIANPSLLEKYMRK